MKKVSEVLICSSIFSPLRFIKISLLNSKDINRAIERYNDLPDYKKRCKIAWNSARYRITLNEYYIFNFETLTAKQKKKYLGEKDLVYYVQHFNSPDTRYIFDNKYETYLHYKDYYKRDVCLINSENDYPIFEQLVKNNKQIIVKPVSSSCGDGVALFDTNNYSDISSMFRIILAQYQRFIAEEVILQDSFMNYCCKFRPCGL